MKTTAAAFIGILAAFTASARPEISWSIMHPTPIDVGYFKRVLEKAAEYGDVDSFEVCGDCHTVYGGINGLSLHEPYPNARASIDPAMVAKARAELNAICDLSAAAGKPLYYWHREIFLPKGLIKDLPALLDEDGEFDLLGKTYQDYLRFKIGEAFRHCPNLSGIALTLTEADFSVIHNSNPGRYPPQKVVEELVGIFAEEHEKRGKRFILRSFGSNTQDYLDIIGGAVKAARRHSFEIETKVTEADFVPWLAQNPFLRKNPPLTLGAECDALGEYLGAGHLPAAQVERIREYVAGCRAEGVDRYTIRIDRTGNSIFDSAHEINLYAYMRFIRDASLTADTVTDEYAGKRFGDAAGPMKAIMAGELEMVRNIHFIASNLTFHTFPVRPDFKYVKAGGVFSVYREGADLSAAADLWAILKHPRTPSHEQILAEKAKGVAMAEQSLAAVLALEKRMPAEEFARQKRAFTTALQAAKALQAYTECVVAYFEDMADSRDEPDRLVERIRSAVRLIESMMEDVTETGKGPAGRLFVLDAGYNLDRVYFAGLRFLVRELLREYSLERALRRRLERHDVYDFVVPGGIYDDNRVHRTMHGAYTLTTPSNVVRMAGNPVFPNGTIGVVLKAPSDAEIIVELDRAAGASRCKVDKSWADGFWTVKVGKTGRDYPAVLSISAERRR